MMGDSRRERVGTVCVLAYAFPPLGLPESALAAKLLSGLSRLGVPVRVLTIEAASIRAPRDESLAELVDGKIRVERFGGIQDRASCRVLQRHLPALAWLPDRFVVNHRRARRRMLSMLGSVSDPMLMSWAQYHSASLVGLACRRRLRVPWIAHWSDPWADNPLTPYRRVTRGANAFMERRVLEGADATVVVSSAIREGLVDRYPWLERETVVTVPHCFDPTAYPDREPVRPGKMVRLRYLGSFYGDRSPEPLLNALGVALRRDPGIAETIRLELIGPGTGEVAEQARRAGLPAGLVEARDPVSYGESLRLMREADVLVVVDAPAARSVFLPSKLVDYLGADRPILAVTPEGVAADVATEAGAWWVKPGDPEAIAEALRKIVAEARKGRLEDHRPDPHVRRRYAAEVVAEGYFEVFERARARVPLTGS